jgi:hypothetical protein
MTNLESAHHYLAIAQKPQELVSERQLAATIALAYIQLANLTTDAVVTK